MDADKSGKGRMTSLSAAPKTSGETALISLLYVARGLRGFGDGFAILILPAYMTILGYDAAAVGIVATASLLGTALLTLVREHSLWRIALVMSLGLGAAALARVALGAGRSELRSQAPPGVHMGAAGGRC